MSIKKYLTYGQGVISVAAELGGDPILTGAVGNLNAQRVQSTGPGVDANERVALVYVETLNKTTGPQYFMPWIDPVELNISGADCASGAEFMEWAESALQSANLDPNDYPTNEELSDALALKLDKTDLVDNFSDPNHTQGATTAAIVVEIQAQLTASNSPLAKTATKAILPNSPTYSNGASGVGATLTAGANAAIVVNGVALEVGEKVLVSNQATTAHNGLYEVQVKGNGATPWVLIRSTDYDTPTEIEDNPMVAVESYINVAGNTETKTIWRRVGAVANVGVDPILFQQYTLGAEIVALNTLGLSQFPDSSTTGQELNDIITDKTIGYKEDANQWEKAQAGTFTELADSATITPDLSASNHFECILGGSRALGEPTNITQGQTGKIDFYQDVTGGRTITPAWCYNTVGSSTLSTGKHVKDMCTYSVDKYATSAVTISIATPGVVTWNGHGLKSGQKLRLTTTGSLPTGLAANTTYWVFVVDANTFRLCSSRANLQGGTYIATSGSQSGVHTARVVMITLTFSLDTNA